MRFKKFGVNRFIAGFLAVLMVISMMPAKAFAMSEGVDYTFNVTDENGAIIEGAKATITVDGMEDQSSTTNAEGVAVINFSDSVVGTYKVSKFGYKDVVGEITDTTDTEFNVQMTELKKEIVTGRVVYENGEGVSGAHVKIAGYSTQSVLTSGTGEYTLNVYEGQEYEMTVTLDGYRAVKKALTYDESNTIDDVILYELKTISDFAFEGDSVTVNFTTNELSYVAKSELFPDAKVSYKSSNEEVATVDSKGKLLLQGVGETTITATAKPGELIEFLETTATLTLKVEKGNQGEVLWSNSVQSGLSWKDNFSNVLTGGIGGTATYKSSDDKIATVDAKGKVTFFKPGTVMITGTMPGGANYKDAISTYEITVGKAEQDELVFAEKTPNAIFYGDTITNVANGGSTGSTATYKSSDSSIASVDASTGKITTHKAGNVTITATVASNDLYNAVQATYDLTIYRAEQKAEFIFAKGDSDREIIYGETFENVAIGGENSPITYKSSDSTIASVDKNTGKVTAHKAGTVTITATNPEDDRFNKKEISYKLTVNRADQTVVFAKNDIPTLIWNDDYTNAATAQTEISYKVSDSTVATIDKNGKLTFKKAGTVTITAIAAKSEQYNESMAEYTITMNKAAQNVTFEFGKTPTTTFNVNDNNYINKATTNAIEAGENDITCVFSIASGSEFVDGDINATTGAFKIKGAGTIVVNVAYESNDRYKLATGSYTLTVEKANQTISFPENSYSMVTGEAFVAPEADELGEKFGTGKFTYTIKEDNENIIKEIDEETGALVLTYKAGTATIVATKAADNNYNETTAEYTLNITEWILDTNVEYYSMTGATINANGWFTGNVSVVAAEGYVLSYIQTNGNATWEEVLEDAVTTDGVANTIAFYVKEIATGKISKQVIETIKKDTVAPIASIEVESLTTWEKFLSIISFGAWNKDTADFVINSDDITSKVAKMEYYVVYDNTELLDKTVLDNISSWTAYTDTVSVEKDSVYVVYAKVTDIAGNYVYASTNGIVFDGTKPSAEITLPTTSTGYYIDDVTVDISVNDSAPYSGIKEVSYKIICDDVEIKSGNLYSFDNENPKYEELSSSWNGNIIVEAVDNNSDDVRVEVTVVDNAGNTTVVEKSLKISAKDPSIKITYVNDPTSKGTNEGVEYYDTNREAQIVITGRTSIWDETLPVIHMTAVNSKGEDVANAYEISDWITAEGENPDDATHTARIIFKGNAKYKFTVDYTDKANRAADQAESNTFVIDHNNPTGTVTVKNMTWEKLLSTLTFGLWSKESVTVSATATDETSAIKSVEYFKSNKDTIVTTTELDNATWTAFEGLSIDADEQFTVYLKITDYAGHYTYISTNGYIVDMTKSTIDLNPDAANGNGYYNNDVQVGVVVKDASPYSGIKKVEYWVTKDGVETQRETIFEFTTEHPTKEQLENEFTDSITVKAELNNSDNVKLYVQVTDNAGNVSTEEKALKIDVTAPKINVTYDADAANVVDDRGYFKTNRTATINITERTTAFDATAATNGIVITGVDSKGNPVALELSTMVSSWKTTEGATPDEAVHTATISYTTDANYDFAISYSDKAGNVNKPVDTGSSITPYHFTVDKTKPTSTVSIDNNHWETLLEVLTFGLWKNATVYVSATSDDATSGTKIEYYKTDSIDVLSQEELDAFTADKWTSYDGQIEIADDERMVVYLKVTDEAENYVYRCSNGYIVDMTDALVTLTPDTPNANGIYNEDVKVLIDVKEPAPYSGIKKVEYWVTKDGIETQRETLYEFTVGNPTHNQLEDEFSKSITVKSELNNSSDVDVYVGVTDNAGNYVQKTVALDIDITKPTIHVTYDNNNKYKVADNRGYFAQNRIATVVITERTNHFDAAAATAGIKITAKDSKNNVVIADCTSLISAWNTVEGATPDEAKHTATISYTADANYTFEISYTDKADNENSAVTTGESITPYIFTVDKNDPTGTVKVGELGVWDKLIEILTFGLWSKETVSVSGTADDATSPIESVSYYKTAETTAKTEEQLENLAESSWKEFKGFDVPANEQFTVYIRIVDFAGNTTYISTNGVVVDNVKPEFKPALEESKPEITLAPVEDALNGLYKDDVTIAVKVVDPIVGNTYSGIKEIRYEITNMGVKTQGDVLYNFAKELGDNPSTQDKLCQSWEKEDAIIVESEKNNSNAVKVKVYVVDNAGNTNEDEIALKIDVTKPMIDITYSNDKGDTTFEESTYFDADRVATINIRERNFNKDKVKVKVTKDGETMPILLEWNTVEEENGNGDETKHTTTITYNEDGDYTFEIAYTDEAGNDNVAINYGQSLAPEKFTVDKTLPTVTITYDNNEALNGNYYKAQRIATIVVTEHNFETSRVKIALKATDNGAVVDLPAVSNWSSNGDVHTATITYAADSLYVFDFDYNDKAGNATADIEEQTFYVDKTNPAVSITKIVDQSANNDEGNIGFVVTATDTNFDIFTPVLTVVDIKGASIKLNVGATTDIANGKTYTVENLAADGIYRITCTVVDKAGNAYSEVTLQRANGTSYVEKRAGEDTLVTFSVNRDGSTYEIDKNTTSLLEKYYVQKVTDHVVITEINPDVLEEYKVTLNGKELEEYTDYNVVESGGNGRWMKYTYTVNKELFADEGEYKLVVSSRDKAKNDAFSDVKYKTINFVVDRTAPVITVSGMATNGRYQTDSQKVTIIPTDDGGALNSLVVRTVDKDGNEMKELINLAGESLEKALEKADGKIEFVISKGLYQNIQIICNDCAVDEENKTNTYNETFTNVSVSSSGFMIFWANKPLRWGTIAGIALIAGTVVTIIVVKKRKNEEN